MKDDELDYLMRKNLYLSSDNISSEDKKFITSCNDEELKDIFSHIEFKAHYIKKIGIGTNRLNAFTIKKISFFICKFLIDRFDITAEQKYSIIISYDDRDKSKEFINIISDVITKCGFDVYMFNSSYPSYLLSYYIRKKEDAILGLSLTALNYPNEYNGIKLYDEKGFPYLDEQIRDIKYSLQTSENEIDFSFISNKQGEIFNISDDDEFITSFKDNEMNVSCFSSYFKGEHINKIFLLSENEFHLSFLKEFLKANNFEVETIKVNDYFNLKDVLKNIYNQQIKQQNFLIFTFDKSCQIIDIYYKDRNSIKIMDRSFSGALLIDFYINTLKRRNNVLPNSIIASSLFIPKNCINVIDNLSIKLKKLPDDFSYISQYLKNSKKQCLNSIISFANNYQFLFADFSKDYDSLQTLLLLVECFEYYLRQGKNVTTLKTIYSRKFGDYIYFETSLDDKESNYCINKMRNLEFSSFLNYNITFKTDYFKRDITDFNHKVTYPFYDDDFNSINCLKYDFEDDGFIALSTDKLGKLKLIINLNNAKLKNSPKEIVSEIDKLLS